MSKRKIDLSEIPRKQRDKKEVIDWTMAENCKCNFIYDDVIGVIEIKSCKSGRVYFLYNNEEYNMGYSHFSYCQFSKVVGKTTSEYKYKVGEVVNNNLIIEQTRTTGNKNDKAYIVKCLTDGYMSDKPIREDSLSKGRKCPVCDNHVIIKGINDVATTHPHLVEYFNNIEDAYNRSYSARNKVSLKCPICKNIKDVAMYAFSKDGLSCNKCGDGYSYPNKFIFNLLTQLKVDFIPEYCSSWTDNKKYDNYIPSINCIIENHGGLHYIENTRKNTKTLKDEQENDIYKEKLAIDNNVKHYVVLDCSNSNIEHIKNSVMNSQLPQLLNFKEEDIDWLKCHTYALSSRIKEACDLWDSGICNTTEISKIMKISRTTACNYLKNGTMIGICGYTVEEGKKSKHKIDYSDRERVVEVFKDGISLGVFHGINNLCRDSEQIFGVTLSAGNVGAVCRGIRNHHKGFIFKYI